MAKADSAPPKAGQVGAYRQQINPRKGKNIMGDDSSITVESFPGAGPAPESTEEAPPPSTSDGDDGVSGE